MKHFLGLILVLASLASFAQYTYHEPRINSNDPTLPEWVKEMYSDQPDVYKVDRLRNQYFERNNRKHDVYTRWY